MGGPQPAVSAVVTWGDRVLLVRRGKPPHRGLWALPGGRVGFSERVVDAVVREVLEETGVRPEVEGLAGIVEYISRDYHYVILVFRARGRGDVRAGGDAVEAGWFKTPPPDSSPTTLLFLREVEGKRGLVHLVYYDLS